MPRPTLKLGRWIQLMRGPYGLVLMLYGALGLVLWFVPLLGILHVEAAAVVALVAFFTAGLSSLQRFAGGAPFGRVLRRQEGALLLPWALLTLSLLWEPNCGYALGLLFYGLFPGISVVLAVALAYALAAVPWRRRRALFSLIGLGIVLLTPLYDLGLHPQFYVYNHVFGGVLGPIYDEELTLRGGLFAFRGLTLGWALLCFLAGRQLRLRKERGGGGSPAAARNRAALVGAVFGIGLCYLFAGPLGINTPRWYLQDALGARYRTAHFDLYYDPSSLTAEEVRLLAEDHEYRYRWLADRLEMDVPERIESYLYPDPETKARLTGARYTNVAPVWLSVPQTHVLLPAYGEAFGHELVHAFSREFGLPLLNASVAVGLVEGLAVALEPPEERPGPHEQVAVAAWQAAASGEVDLAERLAARLSPLGFWTGRGAVSYTTMGSFVRYLLDAYGPARLKRVYAWADFDRVYGKPVERLAQEWERYLLAQPVVSRATEAFVTRRFAVPSLFEKPCPHYVPVYRRRYRQGMAALAAGDTTEARAAIAAALARQPTYVPALSAWAALALARGAPAAVAARLDTAAASTAVPALALRLGDAYALLGRAQEARRYYDLARERLPLFEQEQASLLVLRKYLAQDPAAVRILVSGLPPGEQADRLAERSGAEPAAALYRAVRLAEAGRYEEAVTLLRAAEPVLPSGTPPDQQNLLQQQRLVWLARYAYLGGRPAEAEDYAAQAVERFLAAGALNAAARWADFVRKMAWAAGTEL